MKNKVRYWVREHDGMILLVFLILAQMLVAAFYMHNKQGMYIDEFYCYEGAHNAVIHVRGEQGFRVSENEDWYNTWNTKEDFMRNFEVRGEESVLHYPLKEWKSVIKTQNPYYVLLNIVESLQSDPTQTKWSGYALNSVIFVLHQLVFYLIGREIFHAKKKALMPMLIFGFSAGGITLYTFIRFYLLKSLLCLIIAYVHIRLLQRQNIGRIIATYIVTGLAMLPVLKNQPYIVLYAASAVFIFIILCLLRKDFKFVLRYIGVGCLIAALAAFTLRGIIAMLLKYAQSEIGVMTIDNFLHRSLGEYWIYFRYYFMKTLSHVAEGVYNIALVCLFLAVVWFVQKRKGRIQRNRPVYMAAPACYMVGVSLCYFVINCRIQYSNSSYRYMSCSYAGFCLGIAVLLVWILDICGVGGGRRGIVIGAIVLSGLFFTYSRNYVDDMYPEAVDTRATLAEHPKAANVYIIPREYRRDFYMDTYCMSAGTKIYMLSIWETDEIDYTLFDKLQGEGFFLWLPSYWPDRALKNEVEQILVHIDYKDYERVYGTFQSEIYYLY